jgi:hypothetical protein
LLRLSLYVTIYGKFSCVEEYDVVQVAREKPQFAEITVNTESSSGPSTTVLALFIKNVKPDAITIGWRPPPDPYVEIQMYEVGECFFSLFSSDATGCYRYGTVAVIIAIIMPFKM